MSEQTGRNDPCPCGSGRKYKYCHLQRFYPHDYFQTEMKAFDIINRIQYRLPANIQVGDAKAYARDPMPWDQELNQLLKPLNGLRFDETDRWQRYAKGRINKLHHKLDALQFHSTVFKNEEKRKEEEIKAFSMGTLYNFVIDNPVLIYMTESFLFQSKSCLDVIAQLIADAFKLTGVKTYANFGDDLSEKIGKNSLRNYPLESENLKALLQTNRSWIKYLVEMRNEVTHYSDLEGLGCFLQKKCENKNDKYVIVYYPSLTDGARISTYMDGTLNNLKHLITGVTDIIISIFKK